MGAVCTGGSLFQRCRRARPNCGSTTSRDDELDAGYWWSAKVLWRSSLCGAEADKESVVQWQKSGLTEVPIIVRDIAGEVVWQAPAVLADTRVSSLLTPVHDAAPEKAGFQRDRPQLLAGGRTLPPGLRLTECTAPPDSDAPLELTVIILPGPALAAKSTSGRPIKVVHGPLEPGAYCHSDRNYRFTNLGGFTRSSMWYLLTSNDDKMTPGERVMWTVEARQPVRVHLNFRSPRHATHTAASRWLGKDGWVRSTVRSTVSTGVPNGPYTGPVFSQEFEPGNICLMGSECPEGVYFVFIEVLEAL